jgi:hypothetical protein
LTLASRGSLTRRACGIDVCAFALLYLVCGVAEREGHRIEVVNGTERCGGLRHRSLSCRKISAFLFSIRVGYALPGCLLGVFFLFSLDIRLSLDPFRFRADATPRY